MKNSIEEKVQKAVEYDLESMYQAYLRIAHAKGLI